MTEGLRSKGNTDSINDFLARLDKSIKDKMSTMKGNLDKMNDEFKIFNSRLTNVELAIDGSIPSAAMPPPPLD